MNQSRLMTMAAMLEDQSFVVNRYISPVEWSHDWSRTPDGNYFSNKPPGPMFIGFPIYALLDKAINQSEIREQRDEFRVRHKMIYMWVLGIIFQLIPAILVFRWIRSYFKFTGEKEAYLFFTIFFGNTASFYLANWGGHALQALLNLALIFLLIQRRFSWAGFAFGWALLTDYSQALLLLPAFASIWILRTNLLENLWKFALGGVIPSAFWIWYHQACFGSPIKIANHFQNPMFLDVSDSRLSFFGAFHLIPNLEAAFLLWFGDTRGIIKNQPWIFILLVGLFLHRKRFHQLSIEVKAVTVFSVTGLFLLFWMNASFGHWDGGWGMGPRYMCSIFPALALTAVLWFDDWSVRLKKWLAIGAGYATLYFFYFHSFRTYFLDQMTGLEWFDTPFGRGFRFLIGVAFAVTLFLVFRRQNKSSSASLS